MATEKHVGGAGSTWWKWVCELCFKQCNQHRLPGPWLWTWQSAICPACQRKAASMGKEIVNLRGGCFADGKRDPRSANSVNHMCTPTA